MHRPLLAGCAHGTASIESILSELINKLHWLKPFAVLSCEVPARFTCLAIVMIRAGRSHGVEDHGNNTLSVLFKLKLEQMSCLSCWPKALCECCRQEPFESPKFPKISCKPGHWLSRKKKKQHFTLRNCLCPRGLTGCDSFCPRRELSDIDGSACAKRPHTHTLHTIHTKYTFNGERELSSLVRCCRPRGR